MIANTISRIIARVSRWSATGDAAVRPDESPPLPISLDASPKYRDSIAHSKPIGQSGANHTTTAPQRSLPNRRAGAKSP
jgi:hypothetical protein